MIYLISGFVTLGIIGGVNFTKSLPPINEIVKVKSKIDNQLYRVQNGKDKQNAADLMAQIRINVDKLIQYLHNNQDLDPKISNIIKRYNPEAFLEANLKNTTTSYSINKGEQVVVCLRSKEQYGKLHQLNTLMYVVIHEMGHLMSDSIGHTEEFYKNFDFLLSVSQKIGIYKYINYANSPTEYCGMMITDS